MSVYNYFKSYFRECKQLYTGFKLLYSAQCFHLACIWGYQFNSETKQREGSGMIYVRSHIDYDMAFLAGGTMVRPFV